jgi:hypothetical protein
MTDAELAELNLVFDMQWEADQRAIKAWQAAHPERPNVWPDRCDMVMWLMEHYAQSEARALKAEAECNTCQAGLKASINRFIKAEAALREIMAAFENPATSEDAAGYIMFEIARTALEGK